MEPVFQVHVDAGVDLQNAMVIVGAPGTGVVGATAANHLVEQLGMPCVGSILAAHTPPAAIVRGGRAFNPIRLYHAKGVSFLQAQADQLVVIVLERSPHPAEERALADAIARWARDARCRLLVAPGGIAVDDEALNDKVWGAAGSAAALEILDAIDVPRFEGVVGGLAAGLLTAGEMVGVPAICLLAEAAPGFPDAQAAARIVRLLDKLTLAFSFEDRTLEQEAERIEQELRASLELLGAKRAHTGARR